MHSLGAETFRRQTPIPRLVTLVDEHSVAEAQVWLFKDLVMISLVNVLEICLHWSRLGALGTPVGLGGSIATTSFWGAGTGRSGVFNFWKSVGNITNYSP